MTSQPTTNPRSSIPVDDAERARFVADVLHTSVVGDVLDALGRTHQFLPPRIRRLAPGPRLVGRAMPVVLADVAGPQPRPFGALTDALDQLLPGEIYVGMGARAECAAWGEILTTTAQHRGAVGAILDGYHRDTDGLLERRFPVYSWGAFGQDAGVRTVVTDYRVTVEIDGVTIAPGDLMVADVDGVVVVPSAVEDEVLERAFTKVSAENLVLRAIEDGMSSTDAFAQYGVL